MQLFHRFTPWVEPLSLDEAFLDVTGARTLAGPAPTIAAQIRELVATEERLPCSVGVATTKFVAKLASQDAKPRPDLEGPRPGPGVKVIPPGGELRYLHPLPVGRLWGVGPKTLTRLQRLGISTVGDLASTPDEALAAAVGQASASHLAALARAEDDRPVEHERRAKSISHEETFSVDHHDPGTLRREVVRMADAVAQRLRRSGLAGRTVTLKVRFGDFRTITRSTTAPTSLDNPTALTRLAKELLDEVDPSPGVRLLGVGVSNLVEAADRQLRLDDLHEPAWDDAAGAVDRIRDRYGDDAIGPAALAGPGGLRVKRRGDQQWGPRHDDDRPQET
jgi:DNA polymerase-4